MNKNILITGVTGFIGRHLADYLRKKGFIVTGLDHSKTKIKGIKTVTGDILDADLLLKLCNDANCIIHLAAISYIPDAEKNKNQSYNINVIGTKNVIDSFEQSKAKTLIFASSSKIYGKVKYLPIDEKHTTKPVCEYGRQKLECENYIRKIAKRSQKKYIILRQFNIFGPGQSENFLIPNIISQLKKGEKIFQGNIEVKRDYLFIDDLLDAYYKLINEQIKQHVTILNIGSGKSHSVREIGEEIGNILKIKYTPTVDKNRLRKEDKEQIAGINKIKRLGWTPKISLKKGLEKVIGK
jgi:nucleoside-diphosphate-sugar epimerase